MKTRSLIALFLSLLMVVMAVGACAKVATVTEWAKTVMLTQETTIALPKVTIPSGFLPDKPINITGDMAAIADHLIGDCLLCHGPNTAYFQFPLPPQWDGAENGSLVYAGLYYVVPGSIQDHTGRTPDMCLTCHLGVK